MDYWGYQDPTTERYGFLEMTTLATFGPDPTRPAGRPDPWTTLCWTNHSAETAVLKLMSDILQSLDAGNLSVLVLLFDSVDHDTLLKRLLHKSYRLDGQVINWSEFNLRGRVQHVRLSTTIADGYRLWIAAGIGPWVDFSYCILPNCSATSSPHTPTLTTPRSTDCVDRLTSSVWQAGCRHASTSCRRG